jgi:hypothetical protein
VSLWSTQFETLPFGFALVSFARFFSVCHPLFFHES